MVGLTDGRVEGDRVGILEGSVEGLSVGITDGRIVGFEVGITDGFNVGTLFATFMFVTLIYPQDPYIILI